MALTVKIIDASTSQADGSTLVSFDVLSGKKVVARHSMGFPVVRELVEKTDDDGNPYTEETGKLTPTPQAVIQEAIANYVRDVVPLLRAETPVAVGDEFSL